MFMEKILSCILLTHLLYGVISLSDLVVLVMPIVTSFLILVIKVGMECWGEGGKVLMFGRIWGLRNGLRCWLAGEIQPEVGDIVKKQVVTPVEYYRSEREIEVAIEEIRAQELHIKEGVTLAQKAIDTTDQEVYDLVLAEFFPHIRKHCEFHFGGPCEYKDLCWKPEVASDPVGSGLYQIRMPHHEQRGK